MKILLLLFIMFLVIAPVGVLAQNSTFIVCNGPDCDFDDLLTLVSNALNWLVEFAFFAVIITFVWAGFLLLTSGGNAAKKDKAKGMLVKVVIGFAVLLSAWLIVKLVVNVLLKPGIGNQFLNF